MACNVRTAQNAVQDMASKSYGRLGVANFLGPNSTNICLQKSAISPGQEAPTLVGVARIYGTDFQKHIQYILFVFLEVRPSCLTFEGGN